MQNTPGNIVNSLYKSMKPKEPTASDIEEALVSRAFTGPIVQDWMNEPHRRNVINERAGDRIQRKISSHFGRWGVAFRRIIKTIITPATDEHDGSERCYHATKGWRNYRIPS